MTESATAIPWYRVPGQIDIDQKWMERALELACNARPSDKPFGCVIVGPDGSELVSTWGTGNHDPLDHSEMLAIHIAAQGFQEPTWLQGCSLYSTAEPCPMCCGGINHAKLSRVAFGSYRTDLPRLFTPKRPAAAALADTSHPPVVLGGVLREKCVALFDGICKWD